MDNFNPNQSEQTSSISSQEMARAEVSTELISPVEERDERWV